MGRWLGMFGTDDVQYKQQIVRIQMESIHREQTVEYTWEEGDIVWAKITGYPWWPAHVTQVPSLADDHFRVDFFADNSHAFVSASKLAAYKEHRQSIDMHQHMARGLRKAVHQADHAHRFCPTTQKDPCKVRRIFSTPSTHSQQLMHVTLQQNNKLSQHQQPIVIPSPVKTAANLPEEEESEQSIQRKPVKAIYNKQQRERYVTKLLKKYQLSSLPRLGRGEEPREKNTNSPKIHKNKPIRKHAKNVVTRDEEPSLSPEKQLARKLQRILWDKGCGSGQECRVMSLSLTRQVMANTDHRDNFLRLVQWLQISAVLTIQCYYQNWGSLQTDKDKSSTMTHDQ